MTLTPGFVGPVHVCRRLFCEPTQTLVQQTLEVVMRKDQERFSKMWNFPADISGRQPLASKNAMSAEIETHTVSRNEPLVNNWRLFQPEAAFYTTPPRKLKAYRRLNPSVAQKTRFEMLRIPTPAVAPLAPKEDSVTPLEERCEQLSGNSANLEGRTPAPQAPNVTAPTRPLTPILIRPSPEEKPPLLPYLEHLDLQQEGSSYKGHLRAGHKITLIRSRHSEQVKRRSGAKVTDYFTVSKRPRQSLK